MLALSRKKGESIIIGKDIEVQIIGIQGDKVRLSINAPKNIKIVRKELLDEIKEENRQSINIAGTVLNELNREIKNR